MTMNYRFLADTGVAVSALGFGTMSFGGDADEEVSRQLFQRCRDAGINFFDCADVYQKGRAEEILGRLIRAARDDIVLASKAYFPLSPDVNAQGASRRYLTRAVEDSLRRLGTDRIDIYYIHRFDGKTALEESLRALDDLIRQGKVVYLGASNFAAWQVEKALGVSALHGWASFKCIQPMYNLIKRQAEVEILPMAQAENLAVFCYSPMAGGLLSGKYNSATQSGSGRISTSPAYQVRYGAPGVFATAERFANFARERGFEPAALAVAWAASHPAIAAPLIGARNVQQLEWSLRALEIPMTPELRSEISALSPEPPPATDRSEEGTGKGMLVR
jgi:aryl-alcohol dehydrogenase-like predicted oxidoreductase